MLIAEANRRLRPGQEVLDLVGGSMSTRLDGARAWCHVIYGLHALAVIVGVTGAATVAGAFVFGVPSLLAVVLNYLKRGEVRGMRSSSALQKLAVPGCRP